MAEFRVDEKDSKKLRSDLGVRGSVIAVGLPDDLLRVLGVRSTSVFKRDAWEKWISKIPKADCVLLWIEERRDDDQVFLERLARHLPNKSVLWSFHAMSVLLSDRLTGDAVQTLLTAGEQLDDKGCKNVGVGYYARSFVRSKGSKAEAVETKRKSTRKVVTQNAKDVARRNTIRTQKVKEALERSKSLQSSQSMRQAFSGVEEPSEVEKSATVRKKAPSKEKTAKKAVKKVGKAAGKKKAVAKKGSKKKASMKKASPTKKAPSKKKAKTPVKKKKSSPKR